MSNSHNLALPYVQGGQAQKHVTVNDALRRIDTVVQLNVLTRNRSNPPSGPSEGDAHIVAANANGAWAGMDFRVAAYQDGAWVFFEPKEGWLAYNRAEQALLYFDGSDWEIFTAVGASETSARFGVNTTADSNNRLKVASDSVLFEPDMTKATPTGDVRVYLNKDTVSNTASHIFQHNAKGRAEIGLMGSNDFGVKVSPNGNDWNDALTVRANSGQVDFARMPSVAGDDTFLMSVSSRTAARSMNIPSNVNVIDARGYDDETDGGGGRYERVGALPADGLGFTDGAGAHWSLAGDTVTARQAGAKGNGTTDDTGALRRAFNSGRNVYLEDGNFYITDTLSTTVQHQRIIGDGRGVSRIRVDTAFNMSRDGIIRVVDHWVTLKDFEINFSQAGVGSRAGLIKYPPAVYMVGMNRVRLLGLRFKEAYDGVLATGNCGGAILDDIECGSLNVGFRLGGSLDTVELRNCRVWPYEFAGNQSLMNIFSDGQNIGFRIGRVDDLKMTNCTPFRAKLIFEASDGFKPFGTVNGLALDGSQSSIEMQDGEISISGLYATTVESNDSFINQTGGFLAISDFNFKVSPDANVPLVHVNGLNAMCLIQNGRVLMGSAVTADGFRVSSGKLTVSSVRFVLDSAATRTGACLRQAGGELVAYGNHTNAKSTGSGDFIRVQSDGSHVIFGNDTNGWGLNLPASRPNGTYGPNHNGSALIMDSVLAFGPVNNTSQGGELRLDGAGSNGNITLDNSSGNARFATLSANRALQVVSADGTASLYGDSLRFSNGLTINRGASNEVETTSFGEMSLNAVTTGSKNTAVGKRALESLQDGESNAALGFRAGRLLANGGENVFVGANAGRDTTGADGYTLLGCGAGKVMPGGSGNTGVGRNVFSGLASSVNNATALGEDATVTGSNQVQLGNSLTTTFAYGAIQNRSDARDKADVRETVLGLDFVKALRPVDFRWDYREDYDTARGDGDGTKRRKPRKGKHKRARYHHGFIAQDIERMIGTTGVDFGGYQDHSVAGGQDVKSIGYTELIAPLVKAVQELAVRIEGLEGER